MECENSDLIVEGEVPKELCGTFYRNGPNPQFAPRGAHHWFGGDGMLHAFHITGGKVSYRNRWARTVKWQMEHEAGQTLFSSFGDPRDTDPSVAEVQTDGLANTNVVWHGGKLLALEEGHAPFELDPVTLESTGAWTFQNKLVGPMTAHPKIDPETGEMLFFGYNATGPLTDDISFNVVNADGKLIRSEMFKAPYSAMVHDFIATRDHVIFPIMPLTGSMDRAMKGEAPYAWEPDKGTHIGIMPRQGTVADIRWFSGEPCYVFHPMNAYTQGDRIIADVCQYAEAPLFPKADGSPQNPDKETAHLTRWTFDLAANSDDFRSEQLDDRSCEFARLDERKAGLPYRYGYFACAGDSAASADASAIAFNAIGCIDHQTGRSSIHDMGTHCFTSEPIFVPRSENSAEGEGFLLANIYDDRSNSSHLLVLDAQDLTGAPLAKAQLDHRVPFGFHGNWRSEIAG